MSNEYINDFIKFNKNKIMPGETYPTGERAVRAAHCDDEICTAPPISSQQRYALKTSVHYSATKLGLSTALVNARLKRFLNIRRVEDMNMGQFEIALHYLMALTG